MKIIPQGQQIGKEKDFLIFGFKMFEYSKVVWVCVKIWPFEIDKWGLGGQHKYVMLVSPDRYSKKKTYILRSGVMIFFKLGPFFKYFNKI